MTKIFEIIQHLENLAPIAYQESYDNSGLLIGNDQESVSGVLLTLDVTEAVIKEAIVKGANLVIAHHPPIFKGLKRITGKTDVERSLLLAIKHDVAIYAIHTNLDNVTNGVNFKIAERLGLEHVQILQPKTQLLEKLTFFTPVEATENVLNSLFAVGAGVIGNYSHCSFKGEGVGSFLPNEGAKPTIGEVRKQEEVLENRVEVMYPAYLRSTVLKALKSNHPYEEVAYYVHLLENQNQEVGSGIVGELPEELALNDFLAHLKSSMHLNVIKYTTPTSKPIKRVAVCGGSGGFLLGQAKRVKADVFITADYKYHEFFDAEGQIVICDIGHYESEVYTKDLLFTYLSEKFDNFALYLSDVNTNPVLYYV